VKAIRFHTYGEPDVLRYDDVDLPQPGPSQVRIRVAATSFNPLDASLRAGLLRQAFPIALPHVPGLDVAGIVDALGPDVVGFDPGDAVLGMVNDGAAAEYALAPAEVLAAAPTSISLVDAAALPAVGLTAWQALFEYAELQAGQCVLINGAGGAVGGYAVQLARRAGASVIATASARSAERVRAAGADRIVDHTATPVADAVGGPLDVVLNLAPVPPDDLAALTRWLRPGGIVVSTTTRVGMDASRNVRGANVFVRSDGRQLARLVALVDAGELRVDVAARVALTELRSVHARAMAGQLSGKVVVQVADGTI
jgi:NADPH:quinone reductase-like Zn-dependent oxidoreductase